MRESLHDRFRPFKPYDLVLALIMLVLVAPNSTLAPVQRALTVVGAMCVFFLLDWMQRLVRVPTPLWQVVAIISINTGVVTALIHLHDAYQFSLALAMLNTAFATVAFGQLAGMTTAICSVALLSQVSSLAARPPTPPAQWVLFLAVLLTLVAILVRVNRMQQDALHDVVTGLRNHRYFQTRLREELQRSERQGTPTALLIMDLDNFKQVNDHHGHAVGDAVLHGIAQTLAASARGTDVVCRYGGEEIAMILPGTPREDALRAGERLRQAVAQRADPRGLTVTISVGVAVYPTHAKQADALVTAADTAMYQAKRAGKNRVAEALAGPSPSLDDKPAVN